MRKSGILLHLSSLPSAYGIGKMGKSAYDFVDYLASVNINCWQMLPLSPTGYGNSPYQSCSVRAGNPFFIDFELLKQEGLLKKTDYTGIKWQDSDKSVNYDRISANVYKVLKQAYKNYRNELSISYHDFVTENASWLDDFSLFMAIKTKSGGKPWYEWDKPLAQRNSEALEAAAKELSKDIEFWKFMQYKFFKQWRNLKKYANAKGIEIIGDMPIYVAYDSVEVWTQPELFRLDADKKPTAVAGCPPDDFTPKGQLWGNPVYDWDYHKKTGFEWWIERIRSAQEMFDSVRIDHFRGFESYYSVPADHKTAEKGKWTKAYGKELFAAVKEKLGDVSLIAEDLGFVTPQVRELLESTGFPGMKVLQFAFDSPANAYLPHNYKDSNCIVYTGTHDNDTVKGWAYSASKESIALCKTYTYSLKRRELPLKLLQMAWASVAKIVVAPLQDLLELDSSARMNTPSTIGGNWQYRARREDFSPKLSARITALNTMYNRGRELPDETADKPAEEEKSIAPEAEKKNKKSEATKDKKK